jgi:hypothetical protein
MLTPRRSRLCYQDGADFYDAKTGEVIARYPLLVFNDSDLRGAMDTRQTFLEDHPDCEIEPFQ